MISRTFLNAPTKNGSGLAVKAMVVLVILVAAGGGVVVVVAAEVVIVAEVLTAVCLGAGLLVRWIDGLTTTTP